MTIKNKCYIALGSNLDNPSQQITLAIDELGQLPQITLLVSSSLYRSKAVGPPQDDYINAVVAIETSLSPQQLLGALQALEQRHQRKRTVRWGPRTLDCDILLYGDDIINEDNLIIPHPRMLERGFVLVPLAEIAEDLLLPNGETLSAAFIDTVIETTKPEIVSNVGDSND